MLLSIPIFYFFGLGIGLLLLGCWQLISAIGNTPRFIHTGYKKQILFYWTLCIADLSLIALFFLFESDLARNLIMVISWIAIGAAVFIAGYYLRIYYRLIELLSLRDELDGLTKSKH
jgi:predicted acyltransferase